MCLNRIERLDKTLHAFITVESTKDRPKQLFPDECGAPNDSLLSGVPYSLKDVIDVRGSPTTAHSAARRSHAAVSDSDIAQSLRRAGAVFIGKNSLHELAVGGPTFDLPYPPARNPWNVKCHPGGSSSGSAVAVAAGLAYFSIGTDTRGSVRHPATATGIYGFKPSFGAISLSGVLPLAKSLDHAGTLTRRAHDIPHIMAHLARNGPERSAYLRIAMLGGIGPSDGRTIGIIDPFSTDLDPHPDIANKFDFTIQQLAKAGMRIRRLKSFPLSQYTKCARLIVGAEAYTYHGEEIDAHPEQYCGLTRERVGRGRSVTLQAYVKARDKQRELRQHLEALHSDVDFTLSYSSLQFPCPIDAPDTIKKTYEQHARDPYSVTGLPAMSAPVGLSSNGLPIGLQFAAGAKRDTELVKFIMELEELGITEYVPPPL